MRTLCRLLCDKTIQCFEHVLAEVLQGDGIHSGVSEFKTNVRVALLALLDNIRRRCSLAILSSAWLHHVAYFCLLSHYRHVGLSLRVMVDQLHGHRFGLQRTGAQSSQGTFYFFSDNPDRYRFPSKSYKIFQALESTGSAALLVEYRSLWLDLSHMMQQLGKAYSNMYGMYVYMHMSCSKRSQGLDLNPSEFHSRNAR